MDPQDRSSSQPRTDIDPQPKKSQQDLGQTESIETAQPAVTDAREWEANSPISPTGAEDTNIESTIERSQIEQSPGVNSITTDDQGH